MRTDVAIYAPQQGLLIPFARFDGESWEGLWPEPSDVGVGLENIERLRQRWVIARSLPSMWYLPPEVNHVAETVDVDPVPIVQETVCGIQAALAAKRAVRPGRPASPWVIAANGKVPVSPIQPLEPRSRLAQQVLSSRHVRTHLDPHEARMAREWRERVRHDQWHDPGTARLAPRVGVRLWMQGDADLGPLVYLEREQEIAAAGRRVRVRGHALHWAGVGNGVTWAEVDDGTMLAARWLPLGSVAGSGLAEWVVVEERAEGLRLVIYRLRQADGKPLQQLLMQRLALACARS